MANSQSPLPEGTDSIIGGASANDVSSSSYGTTTGDYGSGSSGSNPSSGSAADDLKSAAGKVGDAASGIRAQAADKARDYAAQGKERAVDALANVTRLVDDAASTIDEKVGEQYGDYARRASGYVNEFADQLRSKDVEDLYAEARDLVRKSPAIAIGAAAAIGFVVARLLKAGAPEAAAAASGDTASSQGYATPTPSTATTVPSDPAI